MHSTILRLVISVGISCAFLPSAFARVEDDFVNLWEKQIAAQPSTILSPLERDAEFKRLLRGATKLVLRNVPARDLKSLLSTLELLLAQGLEGVPPPGKCDEECLGIQDEIKHIFMKKFSGDTFGISLADFLEAEAGCPQPAGMPGGTALHGLAFDLGQIFPSVPRDFKTLAKEDERIVLAMIKEARDFMAPIPVKVEHEESVKAGVFSYIEDRRSRGVPIDTDAYALSPETYGPPKKRGIFSVLASRRDPDWIASFDKKRPANLDFRPVDERVFGSQVSSFPELRGDSTLAPGAAGAQSETKMVTTPKGESWIFKHPRGDEGLSYQRIREEVGAYQLSQALGLGLVQETKFARSAGQVGIAQRVIEASDGYYQGTESGIWRQRIYDNSLASLRVFDYIGNIVDRNLNNLFFDADRGRIKAIDHSDGLASGIPVAIHLYPISGGRFPENYPDDLRRKVARISYEDLASHMSGLISHDQLESIWMRVHIVRQDIIRKHGQLEP